MHVGVLIFRGSWYQSSVTNVRHANDACLFSFCNLCELGSFGLVSDRALYCMIVMLACLAFFLVFAFNCDDIEMLCGRQTCTISVCSNKSLILFCGSRGAIAWPARSVATHSCRVPVQCLSLTEPKSTGAVHAKRAQRVIGEQIHACRDDQVPAEPNRQRSAAQRTAPPNTRRCRSRRARKLRLVSLPTKLPNVIIPTHGATPSTRTMPLTSTGLIRISRIVRVLIDWICVDRHRQHITAFVEDVGRAVPEMKVNIEDRNRRRLVVGNTVYMLADTNCPSGSGAPHQEAYRQRWVRPLDGCRMDHRCDYAGAIDAARRKGHERFLLALSA